MPTLHLHRHKPPSPAGPACRPMRRPTPLPTLVLPHQPASLGERVLALLRRA